MREPQEVIDAARRWVGVKYRHQGRTRRGIDCAGLVLVVAHELELVPAEADVRGYNRLPYKGLLELELLKWCKVLPAPSPGCILTMRWNAEAQHVAVYTGPTVIHAYANVKRVVEHGFRAEWPSRVVTCFAFPGVRYE